MCCPLGQTSQEIDCPAEMPLADHLSIVNLFSVYDLQR